MPSLGRRMARGAAWMLAFKFIERGIGLISTIILARLLVPADFGLVAMAIVIIAVLELLGAFSFDLALIQNQQAERHHYDTAWTFTVIYGLCSGAVLVLAAPSIAAFYAEPRLENILYVLAIATALAGFENIGVVAFRKELDFDKEFRLLLSKKVIAFVITVALALAYRNYWALVIGTLASRAAGVAISYLLHPFRPRLSLAGGRDLFSFSKWMLANNILLFLHNRAVDFIIGKVSGAHALGLYSVAYEISTLPSTQMVAPLSRAVFPGYAKMAVSLAELRTGYLKVTGMITLVTVPVCVGIALTADLLVHLVLGPRWTEIIPIIRILAIHGLIQAMQSNSGSVYLALGQARTLTLLVFANVCILLPALVFSVHAYGAYGAAVTTLVITTALLPLNIAVILRRLQLTFSQLAGVCWRPLLAVLLMSLAVSAARDAMYGAGHDGMLPHLLASLAIGAVIYIASTLLFWRLAGTPSGAERYSLDRLAALGRRTDRPAAPSP